MFGWLFSLTMRFALFICSVKRAVKRSTRTVRVEAELTLLTMTQYEHRQALAQRARLRVQQSRAVVAR